MVSQSNLVYKIFHKNVTFTGIDGVDGLELERGEKERKKGRKLRMCASQELTPTHIVVLVPEDEHDVVVERRWDDVAGQGDLGDRQTDIINANKRSKPEEQYTLHSLRKFTIITIATLICP